MLVISRKNGQKIMINDNIVITIVESKNGSCKIAIEADKDIKIYREEVYYQIKLANLIGKNTSINTVDFVSSMIKNGRIKFNDTNKTKSEEDIIIENSEKSITIKKQNSDI